MNRLPPASHQTRDLLKLRVSVRSRPKNPSSLAAEQRLNKLSLSQETRPSYTMTLAALLNNSAYASLCLSDVEMILD